MTWHTAKSVIKNSERNCIECGAVFKVSAFQLDRDTVVFCSTCSNKKCVRCKIVLSKKFECENKICLNTNHCKPSMEMPDIYCAECMIYVKQ